MLDDEIKEITRNLATSPDFLCALEECKSEVSTDDEAALLTIALYFFSKGYFSRMDFEEQKKFVTRPYVHTTKSD